MAKKIKTFIHSTYGLFFVNLSLVLVGLLANILNQGFCIPTLWAAIAIGISLLFIILSPLPFFKKSNSSLVGFVAGFSFFCFFYCVLFLEQFNLYAFPMVLFFGYGIVLLIPHIFIFQLIARYLFTSKKIKLKLFFGLGVFVCLIISAMAGIKYKQAMESVLAMQKSNFSQLETNFMTEKILGMHFIYHTRICEFDGWRPPKHEPLLVLGMWLNGRQDPLKVSLEERLNLYKTFFPNNTVKFDCSCAVGETGGYHTDELWE